MRKEQIFTKNHKYQRKRSRYPKHEGKGVSASRVVKSYLLLLLLFSAVRLDKGLFAHKVNKNFVKLSNKEIGSGSSAFAIATTSDGLLYKIPKTITNAIPYTITGLSRLKAKNAVFLSQEYVFLLNEENSKLRYHLLKLRPGSSSILDKANPSNPGPLTFSSVGESNIFTYPILGGKDRLICVYNKGEQYFRFESRTNSIKGYGSNGNTETRSDVDLLDLVILNSLNKYFLILKFKDYGSGGKYRREANFIQLSGSFHESMSHSRRVLDHGPSLNRLELQPFGMKMIPNLPGTASFDLSYLSLNGPYQLCFEKMRTNGRSESRVCIQISDTKNVVGILSVPNTNICLALGSSGNWTPGTSYGIRSFKIGLLKLSIDPNRAGSERWIEDRGSTFTSSFPLGTISVIGLDGQLFSVGNYGSNSVEPANIVYKAHGLNLYCDQNSVQTQSRTCSSPSANLPSSCSKKEPYTGGCLLCYETSGNSSPEQTFEYDSSHQVFKRSCQPTVCRSGYQFISSSDKFCRKTCSSAEYWTGKVENSCEPCSKIHPNCLRCSDESGLCQECKGERWILSKTNGCTFTGCPETHYREGSLSNNCLPCSTKISQCLKCTHFGERCTLCEVGFEFISKNTTCTPENNETVPNIPPANESVPNPPQSNETEPNIPPVNGTLTRAFSYFDEVDETVHMVYNKQIKASGLKGKLKCKLLSHRIDEKRRILQETVKDSNSRELNVKNVKIDHQQKRIVIYSVIPLSEVKNSTIQVTTTDREAIKEKNSQDSLAFDSQFPFTVKEVNKLLKSSTLKKLIKILGYIFVSTLTIFSLIMIFISPPLMLLLNQIIQVLDALKLLKRDLPVTTRIFLRPFRRELLNPLFNPLEIREGTTECTLGERFMRSRMSCLAINNMTGLFFICILLILLKIFVAFISRILKNSKNVSRFNLLLVKINRSMTAYRCFYAYLACQVDVLVSCLVAIRFQDSSKQGAILDYILATIIVLMHGFLTLQVIVAARSAYKLKRRNFAKNQKKLNSVYPEIPPNTKRKMSDTSRIETGLKKATLGNNPRGQNPNQIESINFKEEDTHQILESRN